MSKVRVEWQEHTTYEQVFEIEGFDEMDMIGREQAVVDALLEQADWLNVKSVDERFILDFGPEEDGDGFDG